MEFIDLLSIFILGYGSIVIIDTIISLIIPIIFIPFKIVLNGERFTLLCKAISWLVYSIILTRYMDYTLEKYGGLPLIYRALFFVIIASFMYFFNADKQYNALKSNYNDQDPEIHIKMFKIEFFFVNLIVLYLFLGSILYISTPFIDLKIAFDLIQKLGLLKYFALAIFLSAYGKYFFALILAGVFTIASIKNSIKSIFYK